MVAGDTYRVTGSSAGVDHGQPYLDRDTYELRTDETTNELAIRLDWSGDVDLDYAVFAPDTPGLVATGNLSSTTDHELEAFAVRPSSTYWLWVGQFMGTAGTATSYDATICGGHFFQ